MCSHILCLQQSCTEVCTWSFHEHARESFTSTRLNFYGLNWQFRAHESFTRTRTYTLYKYASRRATKISDSRAWNIVDYWFSDAITIDVWKSSDHIFTYTRCSHDLEHPIKNCEVESCNKIKVLAFRHGIDTVSCFVYAMVDSSILACYYRESCGNW